MTVEQVVSKLIGVGTDDLTRLIRTIDGAKLRIEGTEPGLRAEMPVVEKALLRVGKHLFMINWDGVAGDAKLLSVEKYK